MRTFTIVLAFLAAGPAFAQSGPVAPVPEPVTCEREADCLGKLEGLASRRGSALRLTLDGGKVKTFTNSKASCDVDPDKCVIYTLLSYRPDNGIYFVVGSFYESKAIFIVSRKNGKSQTSPDAPVFSPSGTRLVTIWNDEGGNSVADYSIIVWSLNGGDLKEEFRYTPPQKGLFEYWNFVGWEGDDKIKLTVQIDIDRGPEDLSTELFFKNNQWLLVKPKPHTASPDGRYFISIRKDASNNQTRALTIWKVTEGKVEEEITYVPPPQGLPERWEFRGWDGNARLKLKVTIATTEGPKLFDTDATLARYGWTINVPKLPPG